MTFSGMYIERCEEYPIPLKVDGIIYNDPKEVLDFVLTQCTDGKKLANSSVSYYGDDIPVKTQMFNAPELKGKELDEFIQWNLAKNLAFGSDNTNTSYMLKNSELENVSKQIIIAMGDTSIIGEYQKIFKKHKLHLRNISTLPIMLWKLFVHNYPDKKSGCHVVAHMGDNQTIIVVIYNRVLVFTREIPIGVNDIRKALKQRVVSPEGVVEINDEMANNILFNYGIPENSEGMISEYKISLYKVTIFLRPAIERITSEMNRSQTFFKKQYPKINWDTIYVSGIGGKIPGLPETLADNLSLTTKILHPARIDFFSGNEEKRVGHEWLLNITPNLALMIDQLKNLNILPESTKKNYHFTYLSKLVGILLVFIMPIAGLTMYYSQQNIKSIEFQIQEQENAWTNMSEKAKDYFVFRNDLKVLTGFQTFLNNDNIESNNIVEILKLISEVPSKDIKFTALDIDKRILGGSGTGGVETENIIYLTGFVDSDLTVADIHIANLQLNFEQTKLFRRVELDMQDVEKSLSERLFFKLILSL
jgi:Tfp pilus assembly PilM family ATPase